MIAVLALCAQLAAATRDSTYSTPALRALVEAASKANREPPPELAGYSSHIETELALLVRDTLGREHTAQLEQIATTARWNRAERYDLHVVGYRSQTVGVPYSALSIVRAWTVPTLYGTRLSLGAYLSTARPGVSDTLSAIHPFAPAAERELYYRYSGGDTVAVLRIGSRSIRVARIRVRPDVRDTARVGVFDGEIDLDAERAQIVRMRGQFLVAGGTPGPMIRLAKLTGVVGVAYVEFVNAEVGEKYWLPAFQRTEFQASFPLLGQNRPIFRLVSSIQDILVDTAAVSVAADSALPLRVDVTWAPGDSISRFSGWAHVIGAQSSSVQADDFADLAPDEWRATGPPRLNVFPNSMTRMVRFNRVEGLYTGVSPSVDFRTLAPGLTVGATAGWAWTEQTARGGAFASEQRGDWTLGIRAERLLGSTDDFVLPLSEDPGFGALLGSVDDHDYVDRRAAMFSATHVLGSVGTGLATFQAGVARDGVERARLAHGLFGTLAFRPNRGVASGSYALQSADLELHPDVTGDFVQPGVGARLHYESAEGTLRWQRGEVGLSFRQYAGNFSFAAHADGGIVTGGNPPPQTLFEIGGVETLPGYGYKQFAGDRAALVRSFAGYQFDLWRRPIHLVRRFYVPGVSPGLAMSAQAGWTDISRAAQSSVAALGVVNGVPVSVATSGVRGTVGGGLTLFSNLLHVGLARPVDHPSRWRWVAGFGTAF